MQLRIRLLCQRTASVNEYSGRYSIIDNEFYVPNAEDEAIHQMAERGEITTEEVIALFRERALERQRKALAVTDKGANCD